MTNKEEFITVLKVEPMKVPEIVQLKNELHALQEAVSIGAPERGLIEPIGIEDDVDLLLNEEGKLIGLAPNRRFGDDILCGVFYVVGQKDGDFCSLPESKMEKYKTIFATPQIISPDEVDNTIRMTFFSF